MSDKTSLDGTPNRQKQDQALFLVLLIGVGVLFLVFIFISFKNSSKKEASLAQALTLVAEASRTAQAAHPGISTSQVTKVTRSSPVVTKVAIGTASPRSSSVNLTQTASARSPQTARTATRNSAVPTSTRSNTTNQNSTGQNNNPEAPTFPVSNVTVRPTYTPKPTETTRPTDPPPATLTPTATPGPGLPGLSMSNVIGQLENEKEFTCAQEGDIPGPILWMCDFQSGNDLWYHVDLYGSTEIEVTNLLVSVFQTYPDEAKAIDIISFVASLPYDGSNASEASQWVAQTLPGIQSVDDVREKFIGNVRFRLYGDPQGRYLEMGEPVQQ